MYARSLGRLLSQALPFVIVFLVMTMRRRAQSERGSERIIQRFATESPWNSSFLFFAALLVLAVLPYSFLTTCRCSLVDWPDYTRKGMRKGRSALTVDSEFTRVETLLTHTLAASGVRLCQSVARS